MIFYYVCSSVLFSPPKIKFLLVSYRNFRDPWAEIRKIYRDPETYKYFSSNPREPREREDRMSLKVRRS